VCFFAYLAFFLQGFADEIADLPDPPAELGYPPGSPNWSSRHGALNDVYDRAFEIVELLSAVEVVTFWYTLIIVLKFFEAFHANPRLAIISETLSRSVPDLLHFLVIFIAVFGNFALGGYILFGQQVKEWSSAVWALNTSFRALMGDFAYADMYEVAPFQAQVWFWLYVILIFLIMLNMLLAIIMDIYCEVAHESKSQKTLYGTLKTVALGLQLRASAVAGSKLGRSPSMNSRHSASAGMLSFERLLQQMQQREELQSVAVEDLIKLGCPAPVALSLLRAVKSTGMNTDVQKPGGDTLAANTVYPADILQDQLPQPVELHELSKSLSSILASLERVKELSGAPPDGGFRQ